MRHLASHDTHSCTTLKKYLDRALVIRLKACLNVQIHLSLMKSLHLTNTFLEVMKIITMHTNIKVFLMALNKTNHATSVEKHLSPRNIND